MKQTQMKLTCLVLFATWLHASSIFASSSVTLPSMPYEKYSLKNGMEVILQHDDKVPVVAVNVWYHVGSTSEVKGKKGFAHLFEHLMFQGTLYNPGDAHLKYLEEAGASNLNGTTSFHRTNYYETVPKEELELALWLESNRMGFAMPAMTQAILDEQRNVVKNERRQRYENAPYGMAGETLWNSLFPEGHPHHGLVIGSMADLDAGTLDDVKAFFNTFYTPANATLSIVGNYNQQTIKATIEQYFGALQGHPKPARPVVRAPELRSSYRLDVVEPIGKLTRLSIRYLTPPLFAEGDAELDVLSFLLTHGSSSILEQELKIKKQLVTDIDAYQQSLEGVSVYSVDAVLNPGVKAEDVLKMIDLAFVQLMQTPPEKEELDALVRSILTEKIFSFHDPMTRADHMQGFNHSLGNPDGFQYDLSRYEKLTPRDIQTAVNKYIRFDKRIIMVATPKNQP